jgi:hypothetical protein
MDLIRLELKNIFIKNILFYGNDNSYLRFRNFFIFYIITINLLRLFTNVVIIYKIHFIIKTKILFNIKV